MNQNVRQALHGLSASFLLFLLLVLSRPVLAVSSEDLKPLLIKSSWAQLERVVTSLTEEGSESSQQILEHWLNGKLFVEKAKKRLVFAEKTPDKQYRIFDPFFAEGESKGEPLELGTVKKRALKKVR